MKKQISLIIVLIVIVVAGFIFWQSRTSAPANNFNSEKQVASEQAAQTAPETTTPVTATTTPAQTGSANQPAGKQIAMSDLKMHNTTTDCWTVVGTKVYDVTTWISQHPGGERAIIGMCGVDATAPFSKQHGSSEKAQAALANFFIGDLTN